ncbi:MAG TPA: C4-type zinc ribbon domain-containing protein [Opitutaceae bacterium]
MQHPALAKLLILQDRDQNRIQLEAQLAAVPREVATVQQKIAAEKAAIDDARKELRELETKKKLLETELGAAEDKLAKYKTQQMSVRKNDEYQALGLEIEHTQAAIGEIEGRELEVMYAIDEAKRRFAAAEAVLKQNIAGHEGRLKTLAERETNLKAEFEGVKASVAAARTTLDEPTLRLYDRVAARQMPVCVPLRGGKCGGCHLKVSSEVDADARKADKLATCDQCGRIVWWESA